MSELARARTYNQEHSSRKYTPGQRRLSIYWTWSYPWESKRDVTQHGQSLFDHDRSAHGWLWPDYETPEYSAAQFLQGIAGTLELFHLSTLSFQEVAGEITGHPVAVFQRIDQAGYKLPIDERMLADTDTLMVFGLDHLLSEQEAAPEEVEAIREWLKREGSCLLLGPHHDVGFADDLNAAPDGISPSRRRARPAPAALWPVYALADEGARRAGPQCLGASTGARQGHEGDRSAHRLPRPRQARPAEGRDHLQLPSAPAALRDNRNGQQGDSPAGAAADRP